MKEPSVTIIIPFHWINGTGNYYRFLNEFNKFLEIEYKKYEILLITDPGQKIREIHDKKVRCISYPSQTISPADKRDFALKYVKSDLCAFIDDDAYPDPRWIKKAVGYFKNKQIVAVGGPGLTPPDDGYWEKVSGLVYESFFCSGAAQYRFVSSQPRYVDDYPAYNLFVRTKVLKSVNGYGNSFYGGEDTFLCMKLIKKGRIFYDGEVIVYHHRRKLFFDFLWQIANVGMHRGYFARKYPQTSRRWFYFLPSIATTIFIILIILSFINQSVMISTFIILFLAYSVSVLSVIERTNFHKALMVGLGVLLVHFSYGLFFIKGLFTVKLIH